MGRRVTVGRSLTVQIVYGLDSVGRTLIKLQHAMAKTR